MHILVSPAKTLDFETPTPSSVFTLPELLGHSEEIMKVCRNLSAVDIARLMKVSDKIAGLNVARFTEWHPDFNLENAKQAVFAFKGDVYTGLDSETLSKQDMKSAQQKLRILSGLYGLLKPLDLMMPYRLEMGTSLENSRGKNLYQFWGSTITDKLNSELDDDSLVVNLASNEYFKAVKKKDLKGQLITPVFKDCKAGQYKVISFYAKKARGMMARFIIQNNIESREQLEAFDVAGYYYSSADSTVDAPVFLREEQVK
ncbi:peroxide stress protein YaaA [Shewanella sp. 202IG2-18]|uniref:peroxide stress protein YaaA n=1 Tax=Parashewanella hymeniacidonis TaxID=2807618 RepID=UPI001960E5A2|nr:peroxide stress protein YaaA [Parashewanella hymeniacidonis]MBM7071946.1 peroxide stress protein YaaA [Parashewanella hymeniacidonis]